MKVFAGIAVFGLILIGLGLLVSDAVFAIGIIVVAVTALSYGWWLLPDGPLERTTFSEAQFKAWVENPDSFAGRFRRYFRAE